jgi:hypothetical protein
MMNDVKYVPSSESINDSIGTDTREVSDVEKGEGSGGETVEFPRKI